MFLRQPIAIARFSFYHAQVDYLVMTERFHYFYRYRIRGARTVLFYGLPENASFYPEIVNMLAEMGGQTGSVLALYDRFDALTLERIVGANRAKKMVGKKAKCVYLLY